MKHVGAEKASNGKPHSPGGRIDNYLQLTSPLTIKDMLTCLKLRPIWQGKLLLNCLAGNGDLVGTSLSSLLWSSRHFSGLLKLRGSAMRTPASGNAAKGKKASGRPRPSAHTTLESRTPNAASRPLTEMGTRRSPTHTQVPNRPYPGTTDTTPNYPPRLLN